MKEILKLNSNSNELTLLDYRKLSTAVINETPMLIRIDGSVYQLDGHQELITHDVRVQLYDLYIVHPHGEIIAFIALALRQKFLQAIGNRMFFIDRHFDALKTTETKGINTQTITQAIQNFIETPDEKASKAFEKLIKLVLEDRETFLMILKQYFSTIAGYVHGNDYETRIIYPISFDEYYELAQGNNRPNTPQRMSPIIKDSAANVYSFDGDFCGVSRAERGSNEKNGRQFFNENMDLIIKIMQQQLQIIKNKKKKLNNPHIYTISLDDIFVNAPVPFLYAFLMNYYIPLMRIVHA